MSHKAMTLIVKTLHLNLGKLRISLSLLILAIICALSLSFLTSTLTHTLDTYPQWKTMKTELHKIPMGAHGFRTYTNSLANNQLQLGAWHGYNFIYHTTPRSIQTWTLNTTFSKDSYLNIIFNMSNTSYEFIRLSTSPHFENSWITSKVSGEYTHIQSLPPYVLEADSEHTIRLEAHPKGIQLTIDNTPYYLLQQTQFKPNHKWGFQSGKENVQIRSITLIDKEGTTLEENFKPSLFSHNLSTLLLIFGSLAIIISLLTSLISKKQFYRAMTGMVFIIISGIILVYTYYMLTHQEHYYPRPLETIKFVTKHLTDRFKPSDKPEPKTPDKDDYKQLFLHAQRNLPYPQLQFINLNKKSYKKDPPNPLTMLHDQITTQLTHPQTITTHNTLLILGTSQTWGEGCSSEYSAFGALLQQRFIDQNIPISSLVLARQGKSMGYLLKAYKEVWQYMNPDYVLIITGTNDWELTQHLAPKDKYVLFEDTLSELIQLNQSKGIQTILCKEANAIEKHGNQDLPLHQSLDKLSEQYNLPCLELHQHLLKYYQTGTLFWDHVHFTDYAHELTAKYLSQTLHAYISTHPRTQYPNTQIASRLHLNGYALTSKELDLIFRVLKANDWHTQVQHLDISDNNCEFIPASIEHLRALKTLNLSNTPLKTAYSPPGIQVINTTTGHLKR